jgi:hypothetical protein
MFLINHPIKTNIKIKEILNIIAIIIVAFTTVSIKNIIIKTATNSRIILQTTSNNFLKETLNNRNSIKEDISNHNLTNNKIIKKIFKPNLTRESINKYKILMALIKVLYNKIIKDLKIKDVILFSDD